jgi:uncharacterized 2Fe-2S/4Fe-4S cluster protein (DUF4445 family)
MNKFKVTFYPDNKSIEVPEDTTILSAALSSGIYINSVCGGDGICGKCKVFVRKKGADKTLCLACRTPIRDDIEVEVPLGSRLGLSLRLKNKKLKYSFGNFGLALDIGTTTISAQLVNLNNKKILGTKTGYNKQASFGADIITRIIYAGKEDGLEKLHNAVSSTINQIIQFLSLENKISINDITSIVCTGNTTMIHLLFKKDPAYIRREPYMPYGLSIPELKASEARININPDGMLYCVPATANYIGGDTTAGVLSSRLYKQKELSMLIDIGTNGEIALGNDEFIVACAASAGPAFEGSGLKNGMRAASGAIEKVTINPKSLAVGYKAIGNAKPLGICGSGYISLLRNMFLSGIIDRGGKIIAKISRRIKLTDYGHEFILAFKEDTGIGEDIAITETDIDNLKRAKAAIYSAVSILVKHMNFRESDIKNIFIAGGFGTSLDIESAITIGLLPDLERNRFSFVGNSALAGAREILLSSEALKQAGEIARKITYFDLSTDSGYMDEYTAALFFPHTDLLRFPSLKK